MKKTKEIKPSGKYPALYYQEGDSGRIDRIRIIYPSGYSEWRTEYHTDDTDKNFESIIPCWHLDSVKTFEGQIEAMHNYDMDHNFSPAIFLGEIK